MSESAVWRAELPLGDYPQNLARMLIANAERFGAHPVYQEIRDGKYVPLAWSQFAKDISSIQSGLTARGLKPGDRVAIVSRNRQEMLELELAVMSMGSVAVPIFASYTPEQTETLVRFCEPHFVAVAEQVHFDKIGDPESFGGVIHFEPIECNGSGNIIPFHDLLSSATGAADIRGSDIAAKTVCLMMYTSGTMGKPKCVQLTHQNILSQQACGKDLWPLSEQDRFLSYLPWHHSYGGIFEKYSALTSGAVLSLENGYGKDLNTLLENWRIVKPTVFYSVPLVFQALITRTKQDPEIEQVLFHRGLRYIFTAAAPLPQSLSDEFESRGITILEGWGLTETSPCCTVTRAGIPRKFGLVGKPIPGVEIKLSEESEILVRGPNVMTGYFRNPEETRKVFADDGWFRTGDIGERSESGLRLITRKDRIFKLTNAEKVIPSDIENLITHECPFIAWAYVTGNGRDHPVALVFPNRAMFSHIPEDAKMPKGCHCPGRIQDLAHCLDHCLNSVNRQLDAEYSRLGSVMLIDHELSIEEEALTPSMKMAPNAIGRIYKANIEHMYDQGAASEESLNDPVYIIRLKR